MRIILVRHGQSIGNIDESSYATIGDQNISLTDEGWRQAFEAGKFLRNFYGEGKKPPRIWVSPFLRTKESTSALIAGLGDGAFVREPEIREDLRLAEQNFGFLPYVKSEKGFLRRSFARALAHFSWRTYQGSPFMAQPPFGESPLMGYNRVDRFIDTLHRDAEKRGVKDVLVVTHGATIKNFFMRWFHLPMQSWKELKTPGNADIFLIDTGVEGWKARKIYDGETQQSVDENPLSGIEKLHRGNLPPLPDFLRNRLL